MLIYEVNLTVAVEIANEFEDWLKPHIVDVLEKPGFLRANMLTVDQVVTASKGQKSLDDQSDYHYWTVQYFVKDRQSLDEYFKYHAAKLQGDGLDRFGGKFSATRRVMTLQQGFEGVQ